MHQKQGAGVGVQLKQCTASCWTTHPQLYNYSLNSFERVVNVSEYAIVWRRLSSSQSSLPQYHYKQTTLECLN